MSSVPYIDFERRLDDLTTALLVPLRTSKVVDQQAMNGVRQLLSELRVAMANEDMMPKTLAGKLVFVFSSMLSEASHAKNPVPITVAAWDIEEQLARLWGPSFG